MSSIFSEEMKKELIKIIDGRLIKSKVGETFDTHRDVMMGIEKNVKELNERLVDVEDNVNDFENNQDSYAAKHDLETIYEQLEHLSDYVQQDELEQLVGKTMLTLMPEFNKKISKEIKKHLVAIAEFVIKNFKEKE